MTPKDLRKIDELVKTMRHLRSPTGCDWDRKQTPESLRPYILEEAYELIDAIDQGDIDEIKSELGDLLLQIVFQAQIFSEQNQFGIGEVAESINSKLIRRHPHIFNPEENQGAEHDWEKLKQQELKEKGKQVDMASRLPANLPALKQAVKVYNHLKRGQQLSESEAGAQKGSSISTEAEIGQALFSLVCRSLQEDIDPDLALRSYLKNRLSRAE